MKQLIITVLLIFLVSASSVFAQTDTSQTQKSLEHREALIRKSEEDRFKRTIKMADLKFAAKDYVSAKSYYEQALTLKPSDTYSQEKILEINNILNRLSIDQDEEVQYSKLIQKADSLFAAKDFVKAKEYYERAVIFRTSDQYPKDKIAEIDLILKDSKD